MVSTSEERDTLRLILDTHVCIWTVAGDRRLPRRAKSAILAEQGSLLVNAVTAWELADLHHRGRIPPAASFEAIATLLGLAVDPFPAECWTEAGKLPDIHRDPIDRMLIVHARRSKLTLFTGDDAMRSYPVDTIW